MNTSTWHLQIVNFRRPDTAQWSNTNQNNNDYLTWESSYHWGVLKGNFLKIVQRTLKGSPVRYVLKIHFFIESGLKMIQFKIQFKTKSKIFIQKNIHSIESRIFNRIIHSKKWGILFKVPKLGQNMASEPSSGSQAPVYVIDPPS